MSEKRYIVTEKQIFKSIRFVLGLRIADRHFVELLMGDIEQILDFDCFEEYKESDKKMTREEAITRIRIHKDVHKMNEPRAINISEALDMAIKALEQSETVTEFADRCKECGAKYGKLRIKGDEGYKQEMTKSVMLLDLFTKTYCRYQNDYERFGDLKFRCDECPFQKENGACLVKSFKNKYASDYKDFGSMGDL